MSKSKNWVEAAEIGKKNSVMFRSLTADPGPWDNDQCIHALKHIFYTLACRKTFGANTPHKRECEATLAPAMKHHLKALIDLFQEANK